MREETVSAEGNTGELWIPALFLQVWAYFASNGHPDTYPLMPLISIISISIVITVINFTVSSNVSVSSVDQWLWSSLILDQKHEEQRAHTLARGAKPPSLASGLAWPIKSG
jgi:hypothetical protein